MNDHPTVFSTFDLVLAGFLHSTSKLQFLGCTSVGGGRVNFNFADPDTEGCGLEAELYTGAEAPIAKFYDSVKQLRKLMDRVGQSMNSGREHGRTHRS